MKKYTAIVAIVTFLVIYFCTGSFETAFAVSEKIPTDEQTEETEVPTTENKEEEKTDVAVETDSPKPVPTTEPAQTDVPKTQAPATEAPATEEPTTEEPTTEMPADDNQASEE